MKCPVCRTECGDADKCPTCGFAQVQMEFLNKDDAIAWTEADVLQYRQRYEFELQKLTNKYGVWGFRQEWLDYYLQYGKECFSDPGVAPMGNEQIWALKAWLLDSNLIQKEFTKLLPNIWLYKIAADNGAYSNITWSLIWANLAQNSPLIKWYCTHIKPGTEFGKNDIAYLMGNIYDLPAREKLSSSLIDTFIRSPIGEMLMQGMPLSKEKNDKRTQQFLRKGIDNIHPAILLYSIFLYVQRTESGFLMSSVPVRELTVYPAVISRNATPPIAIWGMNEETIRE